MNSSITTLMIAVGAIIAILYLLSIAYVAKDARQRSESWQVWVIISLIPLIGFVIYCVMRPSLTTEDRDEQELELMLKRRQLMHYGECGHCGYPVEADYVLCPHCHQRLKNLCPTCHHALNPEWSICPYCTTVIHGSPSQNAQDTGAVHRTRSAHEGAPTRRRAH